jgi:NAD(P)H-dependent flavin oxidoreductase YrpB (nitropropane dioxygenase family)
LKIFIRGAHGLTSRQSDYTKGQLPELIEVIIEEKAALFVCAIGVPPRDVVDKLHQAGIPVRVIPRIDCLFNLGRR